MKKEGNPKTEDKNIAELEITSEVEEKDDDDFAIVFAAMG